MASDYRTSEADGYFFKSGSAELSPTFHDALMDQTPFEISNTSRNTMSMSSRWSATPTSGRSEPPVLQSRSGSAVGAEEHRRRRQPYPLGQRRTWTRRAVAVVAYCARARCPDINDPIVRRPARIDETLAIAGSRENIQQRRRIEIRFRKSAPKHQPFPQKVSSSQCMPQTFFNCHFSLNSAAA